MKNRNIKTSILLNVFLFLILLSLAVGLQNQFYNMEEVNCKKIMSSSYEVSTDSVSECYKFNNFPFWNFYVEYYLFFGFIHLLLGMILNFILDTSCMWDREY